MNILLVGSGVLSTQHGGGEVYVRNLISGLMDQSHRVFYLFATAGNVSELQLFRIDGGEPEKFQLLFPKKFECGIDKTDTVFIESVAKHLQEIGPDVIHAHGWKHVISLASRKAGIPCIVTVHHGGFVCPAGALLNAEDEICAIPASDSDCLECCVKSVPGWKFWYPILKSVPLPIRLELGKAVRRLPFIPFLTPLGQMSCAIEEKRQEVSEIGAAATRIIAPSPAMAEALYRNGVPADKVWIVSHGIPPVPRFPLREDAGEGKVRFAFVGRINHVKGVHILLEACMGLPRHTYELHIVGGAATRREKRYLNRLLKRYRSVNAIWHGSKRSDEVAEILCDCDVLVHPTICLEVFGLSIAEALSAGRPVIATRCGGAEIQIKDGENGLLVPPNDVEAFRQAMERLIENRDLLRAMAERTTEVNSIDAHVHDLEKIYEENLS